MCHPACATARTETAIFAAEGDELLVVTAVAAQPEEAAFESAAIEVAAQCLLDVAGDRAFALGALREKGLEMFLDQLVEQRVLGTASGVVPLTTARRGLGARGGHPCLAMVLPKLNPTAHRAPAMSESTAIDVRARASNQRNAGRAQFESLIWRGKVQATTRVCGHANCKR